MHERRERERKRARRGQSRSLCPRLFRGHATTRSGTREREKERKRSRVCIISNDYLVVVLVADDRSQSRDVAQSQDDEAETITTIPRRRPHRPPPRCFGAGLLHNNREGERQREICVSRSNLFQRTQNFFWISLLLGFRVLRTHLCLFPFRVKCGRF